MCGTDGFEKFSHVAIENKVPVSLSDLSPDKFPKALLTENRIERSAPTQSVASLTRLEQSVGTKILSVKPVYPLETDLNNEIEEAYLRSYPVN